MAGHPRRTAVTSTGGSQSRSDPAAMVAALKRQLRSSGEWESICQRAEGYISAQLAERGSEGAFSDLPEVDRIALIERTKRELARDGQLAELKMAVKQKLTQDQSHSREPPDGTVSASPSQHSGRTDHSAAHRSGAGPDAPLRSSQELAADVCRYLLLKWPHLTRQLSRYILCPFPETLRPVLWEHCLKQGTPGRRLVGDFPHGGAPPGPAQLAGRCQNTLSSLPPALLCGLQQWPHTVRVMTEAVESLTQREGSTEEVACVLVLPFVYAHMSSIQSGATQEAVRGGADLVGHQFTVFMRTRPWHLHSATLPVAHDAAAMFCGKVNRLLISADPELHSSLCSSLAPPPREEGLSLPTQDQFVRSLRDVLHPLMAQLFVGTVPLTVVCVLFDQHLLSLALSSYDPLPFCVAALLLLSRRELLRCRNMDDVQTALKLQRPSITPQALLGKIKQCFAGDISQQVKASNAQYTFKKDDQETAALRHQVHSLETLLSVSSPPWPSQGEATQGNASAGRRSESQHTQSGNDQLSRTLTGSTLRSSAGSSQTADAGSNQGSVARITQRLAAGSNQGSVSGSNQGTTVQVERPQGGREVHMASATQSQANSRHHLSPFSSTPSHHHTPLTTTTAGQSSEDVTVTSPPTPVHVTNLVSVNVTAVSPPGPRTGASSVLQSQQAMLQDAPAPPLEEIPSHPAMQQVVSPTAWSPTSDAHVDSSPNLFQTPPPSYPSTAAGRMGSPPMYSGDAIARSRAQEFWLHVLSRFSDALYLLFHGPEEEAHELERQLAADQDSLESL